MFAGHIASVGVQAPVPAIRSAFCVGKGSRGAGNRRSSAGGLLQSQYHSSHLRFPHRSSCEKGPARLFILPHGAICGRPVQAGSRSGSVRRTSHGRLEFRCSDPDSPSALDNYSRDAIRYRYLLPHQPGTPPIGTPPGSSRTFAASTSVCRADHSIRRSAASACPHVLRG